MKRRDEKLDREAEKEMQEKLVKQMQVDNKTWKAVDSEDARHMKKEAEKIQKDAAKANKKREKEDILRAEEEKACDSQSSKGSKKKR